MTDTSIIDIKNRYTESVKWIAQFEASNCDKLVLDAGAGEQRARAFFKNNKYISQDFGEYKGGGTPFDIRGIWDRKWDSEQCDILSDICHIPVEDQTFDPILCFEVIEHVPEPLRAIKELARLLKPHGKLLITAPNLCAAHQEPFFYYSGFSDRFFIDAVTKVAPEIELIYLGTERNFTQAHLGELKTLSHSQKNPLLRFSVTLCVSALKGILSLLALAPGFKQPKSCSGFFAIFERKQSAQPIKT